jgi:hypothetical protein
MVLNKGDWYFGRKALDRLIFSRPMVWLTQHQVRHLVNDHNSNNSRGIIYNRNMFIEHVTSLIGKYTFQPTPNW